MEEEKQKSLEVVNNAQKTTEELQRKLEESQKETEALQYSLQKFTDWTANKEFKVDVQVHIAPETKKAELKTQAQRQASRLSRKAAINVVDLTAQDQNVLLVETVCQQTAGVIDTLC